MKVLVPVKKVLDYSAKIKVKEDGSGVETNGIKTIINPFDEIAVEEALKLKESGKVSEVVVVTIGEDDSVTQLRYAMAMGADSAIHVKTSDVVDSDLASRVLAEVYKKSDYGFIIMGKQAIDSDAGQTPQLIAARLDIPHASFASKVEMLDSEMVVTREVDGGLENLKVQLPAVISTDLRLNEPRYAPLPGIMKAKKKPVEEIELSSLGLDINSKVKILKVSPPAQKQAGKIVESVDELVSLLKEEAKVL